MRQHPSGLISPWKGQNGSPSLLSRAKRLESDVGQSRRFPPLPVASGLRRTTDVARTARLVRFVPRADRPFIRSFRLRARVALLILPNRVFFPPWGLLPVPNQRRPRGGAASHRIRSGAQSYSAANVRRTFLIVRSCPSEVQANGSGERCYGRASKIMLNGVSAARRICEKPRLWMTSRSFFSPAARRARRRPPVPVTSVGRSWSNRRRKVVRPG